MQTPGFRFHIKFLYRKKYDEKANRSNSKLLRRARDPDESRLRGSLLFKLPCLAQSDHIPYFNHQEKYFTERSEAGPGWIQIWTNPKALQIPQGFYFKAGSYFEPSLNRAFWKLQKAHFDVNKNFIKQLDKTHKIIDEFVRLVVIYNRKSTPIGAGLVAIGKIGNFLYCGSIDRRFRRKGLWKFLVAARQSVSNSGPGTMWILLTRNAKLFRAGEARLRLETYFYEGSDKQRHYS